MDRAGRSVVIVRQRSRTNEATAKTLVVSLRAVVHRKFAKQMPKMRLAEYHEVIETFGPDGPETRNWTVSGSIDGPGPCLDLGLCSKLCRRRRSWENPKRMNIGTSRDRAERGSGSDLLDDRSHLIVE